MALARREYVDAVTGEPVRKAGPGAVASGRWVARVSPGKGQGPVTVEIDREELDPLPIHRADLSRGELVERAQRIVAATRGEAKTEAKEKRRKGKQRIVGVSETFRSSSKAADEFISNNAQFFEALAASDPIDVVTDWMDRVEVRRGPKSWRSLDKTTKGKAILAELGTGHGSVALRMLMIWIFSQAKSKRYRDVDWQLVRSLQEDARDRLDDLAERHHEHKGAAVVWYPPAAFDPEQAAALSLDAMTDDQAAEAARVINVERVGELVTDLRAAYKAARKCLTKTDAARVRERIRLLAKVEKHPGRVTALYACVPEGVTRLCGFPVLQEEASRLRRACADGYSVDWPIEEATRAIEKGDDRKLEQLAPPVVEAAEQRGARRRNPGKAFVFTAADGTIYKWSRAQLDDTILESPAWDTAATRKQIAALKPGQKMKRKGETLQRAGGKTRNPPRSKPKAARKITVDGFPYTLEPAERNGKQFRTVPRSDDTWVVLDGSRNPVLLVTYDGDVWSYVRAAPGGRMIGAMWAEFATVEDAIRAGVGTRSNPRGGPPNLADLGACVELGRVIDLETEDKAGVRRVYTWRGGRPLLLWSPRQRALVWFEGVKPSGLRKGAPRGDGAARLFEDWADGAAADRHRTMEIPGGRMALVGAAIRIAYSEPYGREPQGRPWEHDFSPSDRFWRAGKNGAFAFAVTGPRLTVTERGIVY